MKIKEKIEKLVEDVWSEEKQLNHEERVKATQLFKESLSVVYGQYL